MDHRCLLAPILSEKPYQMCFGTDYPEAKMMKPISISSNSLLIIGFPSSVHFLTSFCICMNAHNSSTYPVQNQFLPGTGCCSHSWSKSLGEEDFEVVSKECSIQFPIHGRYAMGCKYKYNHIIVN